MRKKVELVSKAFRAMMRGVLPKFKIGVAAGGTGFRIAVVCAYVPKEM